jgi:hypothetical protein
LVGIVLVEIALVQFIWFMVCNRCEPVCMVLGLATSGMPVSYVGLATVGMPVSSVGFGYTWDACELYWFGYRWDACKLCWFWLQVGCL